ncbi:MAG: AAA family ATPase [Chlamydiia bacterium]|nr:AAA family ATPase [Chlamydiia bacterium]
MGHIFGREREIGILDKLVESSKAEFLAIYGRRRVGKTFLVDSYFRDKGVYFHFTGMKGATLQEHLKIFRSAVKRRLSGGEIGKISSWIDAFEILIDEIEKIDQEQKVIIFFDELPWIDTRRSGFLKALEHFWNDYFSRKTNAILVVCGSAASWMIEKIVHNKGGLHNRLTAKMRLEPFTLKQTKDFLEGRKIHLSDKQIIDLYLAVGGVAKYLTYVEKGLSTPQIIQHLCFMRDSPLVSEYKILYSSLFNNYHIHMEIVEALAKKRSGLTHSELLKAIQRTSGGRFSSVLEELSEAGFISFIPTFNKKKKEGKYYLVDEYTFFYLTWIKTATIDGKNALSSDHWLSLHGSTKFSAWAGFAFETLCKKHISEMIHRLGINTVAASIVHWVCPHKESQEGLQIDLIIDRNDNAMNLCEIKYYNSVAHFSSESARKMNARRERFRVLTRSRKTLFNTLISVYGAEENSHYLEAFDNQITADAFFVN